ncbi:MAG: enolase C-terminal domain-like protein [Dehalococcoidia bacterium]
MPKITCVGFYRAVATQRTTWYFAEFFDEDGFTTTVEITKGDKSDDVIRITCAILEKLKGVDLFYDTDLGKLLNLQAIDGRSVVAASLSAIRSAISQLEAMHSEVSLCEYLGGTWSQHIPLYGNINRRLFSTDRTPSDFADAAESALNNGFTTIKCAPFDEVFSTQTFDEQVLFMKNGLERIREIRSRLGFDVGLLIDCHARFSELSTYRLLEELEPFSIDWLEEPLDPSDHSEILIRVVDESNIPIAGGESGYGTDYYSTLVKDSSLNIIMPDVKYCGGVAEASVIGNIAAENGKDFSIHCPSGPVSLHASGHSSLSVCGSMFLEHAVDEVPWRKNIIEPCENIYNGELRLENEPGIGIVLNHDIVESISMMRMY